MYQNVARLGQRFFSRAFLFKYGFNFSPMYRRSCSRVVDVTKDLKAIRIRLKYSYKNKNYVGSIFGGSLFSAVDPFPMVQLINIIDRDYVIWDKAAQIRFRRPAFEDLYADFTYTDVELKEIRKRVQQEKEIEIIKSTSLRNKSGDTVFCTVDKTLYIADKQYFKTKRKKRSQEKTYTS